MSRIEANLPRLLRCFRERYRFLWRQPQRITHKIDNVHIASAGIPDAICNRIYTLDPEEPISEETMRQVVQWYDDRGEGFTVFDPGERGEVLETCGVPRLAETVDCVLWVGDVAPPEHGHHIEEHDDANVAGDILEKSFGWGPRTTPFFRSAHYDNPELPGRTFVGYLDGQPMAAGVTKPFPADPKIAFLLGAGVLEAARGKGLYRALLETRLYQARCDGIEFVVTQADVKTSAASCLKAGFQEIHRTAVYLRQAPLPVSRS